MKATNIKRRDIEAAETRYLHTLHKKAKQKYFLTINQTKHDLFKVSGDYQKYLYFLNERMTFFKIRSLQTYPKYLVELFDLSQDIWGIPLQASQCSLLEYWPIPPDRAGVTESGLLTLKYLVTNL